MTDKLYVDLHLHTRYSDGWEKPEQVVVNCAAIGDNVIAITDHDTTVGYEEAKKEAERWNLEVITGVEVSCVKHHILGYNFDINNKALQDMLAYSRECQSETVRRRIALLQAKGVPITFEKVRAYFPNSRLGKFNLSNAMLLDDDCRAFHGNLNSDELFNKYVGKGGIAGKIEYPAFLKENDVIKTIHQAGGIAVVAHPFKDAKVPEELDALVGLDGLEYQPNYNGSNEPFVEYAKKRGLMITYGSDYHGVLLAHRPLMRRNGNLMEKFW